MLIEAAGLVKNYGRVEVIKNIGFTLNTGDILGFLGPNGTGKTTVMRMLSGFHFPDSGVIRINGISIVENPVEFKKHIGYLPENIQFYGDMVPAEYLEFIAKMRLVPKNNINSAIENVIDLCGLRNHEYQKIETLSRGYKQRLGLAQAVVHNPSILILDEPMTGLDPGQIVEFRSLLAELGKTKGIIFSTHILQEVWSICTDYLILNEGCIAANGKIERDGNQPDAQFQRNIEAVFADIGKGNTID